MLIDFITIINLSMQYLKNVLPRQQFQSNLKGTNSRNYLKHLNIPLLA